MDASCVVTGMTGSRALSRLTAQWYLFALAGGAFTLWANGLGVLSLLFAGVTTALSLGVTYWIGEGLKGRKQWLRVTVVALAGSFAVLGAFGVWQLGAVFLATWRFAVLVPMLWTCAVIAMQVSSIRVLLSAPVSRHFR